MKAGRKNLKRAAAEEHSLTLEDGQSIMQVLSLRGSNLIEVLDPNGEKSLALFPAKFQKSMWIKNGSFVVVDRSGKEKAIESGSKVTCIVSQVLFHEHVRTLQKSPTWPEVFKTSPVDATNGISDAKGTNQEGNDLNSSDEEDDDDDGLPPLEANMNRVKPPFLDADAASDTGSDSDS
ncbi:Probable RNA-binding protein EIF1AD [Linum perenne]